MFPQLVLRVLPRAAGLLRSTTLRVGILPRHQLITRTFLTTPYLAEPAAKASATKAKASATKKNAGATEKAAPAKKRKTAAKKPATKKTATKKPKAKPKKDVSDDPNARFKNGLMAVKIKRSERPPLGPPTAYGLYLKEQHKLNGPSGNGDPFIALGREVAARWKALSDEEKKPYYDLAAQRMEEYRKARAEWFEKADPRLVRAFNAQRKAKNQRLVRAPQVAEAVRKPPTPYFTFLLDKFHSIEVTPGISNREALIMRSKKLSEMWKAMSAEEQEPYVARSNKAFEAYRKAKAEQASA